MLDGSVRIGRALEDANVAEHKDNRCPHQSIAQQRLLAAFGLDGIVEPLERANDGLIGPIQETASGLELYRRRILGSPRHRM